jgi:hypothetical protein
MIYLFSPDNSYSTITSWHVDWEQTNKEVLDSITSNTSDHYPIRMEFKFDYKACEKGSKDVQKIERKIKWEKVDKDLYLAMVQTDIDQLENEIVYF